MTLTSLIEASCFHCSSIVRSVVSHFYESFRHNPPSSGHSHPGNPPSGAVSSHDALIDALLLTQNTESHGGWSSLLGKMLVLMNLSSRRPKNPVAECHVSQFPLERRAGMASTTSLMISGGSLRVATTLDRVFVLALRISM